MPAENSKHMKANKKYNNNTFAIIIKFASNIAIALTVGYFGSWNFRTWLQLTIVVVVVVAIAKECERAETY